jgi:hypothetical protein
VGAVLLGCYALFIQAQAESLLRDITALRVGGSTEPDVEHLTSEHSRYVISRVSRDGITTTTFKVPNNWLAVLRLEPLAWFGADVSVKNGRVVHISASLLRTMDIFPTFQASAGMVDEYVEYPEYFSHSPHYDFLTAIGKTYLHVQLDSQASPIQRQHAFNFSFRCLIKPGGGCDLPCDYLPSAWQDYKIHLQEGGLSDLFNQQYPKASRCGV